MERSKLLTQSQADASPLVGARLCSLHSVEAFEQAWQGICGDAYSRVRHCHLDVVTAPPQRYHDSSLEGVLEGVGNQVQHNLLPHLPVNINEARQGRAIYCQT